MIRKYHLPFPEIQKTILRSVMRRQRPTIALLLLTTILSSACLIGAPLLFSFAVGIIQDGSYAVWTLTGCFLGFAALLSSARLLADIRMVMMHTVDQDVRVETNKLTLHAMLKAAPSIFVANNPSRISEIVGNLHQSNTIYVQSFLVVILGGIVDLLFAIAVIGGLVSWSVAGFVVVYGVATVWLTLFSNRKTTPIQRNARRKSAEGSNLLGNVVNNIVPIKIFRSESWVSGLYGEIAQSARSSWLKYFRVRVLFGGLQSILLFVQYGSILAMLALTLNSTDLLAQIVLVGMILAQLNAPFEMIAGAIEEYAMANVMAETFQDEIDQHPGNIEAGSKQPLGPETAISIKLENLSFTYSDGEKPLFEGLNAVFAPGRLNFIVGPSGVGKSTLLQIVLGINELYQGKVSVGSRDLRSIQTDSWLGCVGYVTQEPMLMNRSVRDNVLLGRFFTDERVREALNIVKLDRLIDGRSGGLDYQIGERGQLLSGGERQRLAIARAIIARPSLLILDEPSSALDEATERGIYATLREIRHETTIIAVTHRLQVISAGDYVIALKEDEPGGAEVHEVGQEMGSRT